MIDQTIKDLYYLTFARLSYFSYAWISLFQRHKYDGGILHLGCGTRYIDGMVNIDGNFFRKKDVWLDILFGLPFASDSARGGYAHHILEHFENKDVRKIMAELYRVIRPGGVLRIGVPSLEYTIREYYKGGGMLPDFPEPFRSPGGKFSNYMLCANQHKIMFDFSLMSELLLDAGFKEVRPATPCRSDFFESEMLRFEDNSEGREGTLLVEAIK